MASSSNKSAGNTFMPSGYDYEFVEEVPEEYHCSICFYPMWKPVQTKCGHRFCEGCLKEANKSRKPPQCPEDRQELRKQDIFNDKALERRILSLEIKCPNDGCPWQGALGDLKDHTCSPVGKERKGGQKRKKEKIADPPAEERSSTLVPCVYQRFGCDVKVSRKDMDKHIMNSIEHHFHITSERLLLLENENLQLKKNQVEVKEQYQDLKESFRREKEERENVTKELTSLKTNVKHLRALNSQKGDFSKEFKTLKMQIKQQVDEQAKDAKTTVTAMMNKDLAEKIERSRLRMNTSINELRCDFENKMKETIDHLQQKLHERVRDINRTQLPKSSPENADRKTKINTRIFQRYLTREKAKLIMEQQNNAAPFFCLLFCVIVFALYYKDDVLALLLES